MEVIPTVYCVVPVYNRLEITKSFLVYINEQDYLSVRIIIIDDGSTDGTGEYLEKISQSNLTILKGDGNLWWSGAMHLGMSYVMDIAQQNDYLLMINDDVRIERNYISTLVRESITNGTGVVGSSQRDNVSGELLNSGWHINYLTMSIFAVSSKDPNITVDALSGRGVLFPLRAIIQAGRVNVRLFPHYLADIEYTARVAELGWKILVSKSADVFYSSKPSDFRIRARGMISKYFSFRSSSNLLHRILFFSVRGPLLLRILVIPRYPFTLIAKCMARFYAK